MPLTSDGCLVDQTPLSTQTTNVVQHAPPLYGEHILDQLYADMDQSGLMTPAPQSGMNTPFYSQSRRGSHEDLSSSLSTAPHPNGAVPPAALSSRLQNLNATSRNNSFRRLPGGAGSGSNTPHPPPHSDGEPGYFDQPPSGQHSNPLSRRTSEEEQHNSMSNPTSGYHTPEHIDYSELGDLSKVPSYTTALKAPIRSMSYTDALPNYDAAISAPPSPPEGSSHPGTPAAGLANGGRVNPLASMGFTPIHPPAPVHMGDEDERRRLHFLQNRH